MSEWKEGKLSDIAVIIMGQSPEGETCNTIGQGFPLLNGPTEFGNKFPTPAQFTLDPRKISEPNDILFCVRGSTTGKMNWSDQKYAIGRGLAAIRHKNGNGYQSFLRGLLDYHLPTLLQSATGSTFPNVSASDINDLEILIPAIDEQSSIASILSSIDDKIDLLHHQNKTLEQLAETLFRQWFVEDSKWDGKLSEYIKVQGGFAFKSQDFKENSFAGVIKITNISMGSVDIIKTQFVDEEVVKDIDEYRFRIKSGDFLIAMTGAEIGKIGIVENTTKQLWLNQRVGKLIEKIPWGNYVGYLALKSRQGQDYISNTCSGSAQENISSSSIEGMDFAPYSEEKTNNFGVECKSLFDKIIFNMEQIKTLSHLRDTLLPKLMSGEIRVN